MSLRSLWRLAVAALAGTIVLPGTGAAQTVAQRPTLVVFFTVGQMRPDYVALTRLDGRVLLGEPPR